jgi:hypothetical protein
MALGRAWTLLVSRRAAARSQKKVHYPGDRPGRFVRQPCNLQGFVEIRYLLCNANIFTFNSINGISQ